MAIWQGYISLQQGEAFTFRVSPGGKGVLVTGDDVRRLPDDQPVTVSATEGVNLPLSLTDNSSLQWSSDNGQTYDDVPADRLIGVGKPASG